MKAKEYLQQLKRLDTLINQKMKELDKLRNISTVGSVNYAMERVQSSYSQEASFIRNVHKVIELEQEINDEIDNFVDTKHLIINQIQTLKNSDYIILLFKRYVEYKSLEKICVEMKFSYDYIKHLHGYALKDFENTVLKSAPQNT